MQLTKFFSLLLAAAAAGAAGDSSSQPQQTGTTVTLAIPASPHLPNPAHQLSASRTHATLTRLGASYDAPLSSSSSNTNNNNNNNAAAAFLVFRNVTAGSYVADVHSPSHGFAPLRIDVGTGMTSSGEGEGEGAAAGQTAGIRVWETFRGNEWENKGEEVRRLPGSSAAAFPVRVLGSKTYYVERGSCKCSVPRHPSSASLT